MTVDAKNHKNSKMVEKNGHYDGNEMVLLNYLEIYFTKKKKEIQLTTTDHFGIFARNLSKCLSYRKWHFHAFAINKY